jgi:hypothetical protein
MFRRTATAGSGGQSLRWSSNENTAPEACEKLRLAELARHEAAIQKARKKMERYLEVRITPNEVLHLLALCLHIEALVS